MSERAARLATVRSAVGVGRGVQTARTFPSEIPASAVGVQAARTKTRLSWSEFT